MVHNFVRSHFTTRKVSAVALGILQKGLTWEDLLQFVGFVEPLQLKSFRLPLDNTLFGNFSVGLFFFGC
jgi:hypothetical protein